MPVNKRKYRKRYKKYKKKYRKAKKVVDKIQNARLNTIEQLMLRNSGQLDYSINRFPLIRPSQTGAGTSTNVYGLSLNNMILQGPFECNRRDKSITLKNLSLQLLLQYDLRRSLITDPTVQPQTAKCNILIVRFKESFTVANPVSFAPQQGFLPYDDALRDITLSCQDQTGEQVSYIQDDPTGAFGIDRFSYLKFNTNPVTKYEVLYNQCHFMNDALLNNNTTTYTPPGYPTKHGATYEKIVNINLKSQVIGKVVEYDNDQQTEKLAANTPGNLLNTLGVPEIEPQTVRKGEIMMWCWSDVDNTPAGTIVPIVPGHMRRKWL